MKYIKNRTQMNAFVDAALIAKQSLEEFRNADGKLSHLLNKQTQESFDIEWADAESVEEFDKRIERVKSTLIGGVTELVEEGYLDTMIVIMGKYVERGGRLELAVDITSSGINEGLAEMKISELYEQREK